MPTPVITPQPQTRTLRVACRINDDDTRHRMLSARVPGWIEKLFISFVGAPFAAGESLPTLWSPDAHSETQ